MGIRRQLRQWIRHALPLPAALIMSIVLAGQVAAATWTNPAAIAPGAVFAGIIGLDFYSVLAVYNDETGVFVKHSTDRGKTWQTPVPIASDAFAASAVKQGSTIHLVFHKGENFGGYGEIHEAWYTRSFNGGQTWTNPIRMVGPDADVNSGGVLTGPNGLVMFVWTREVWNSTYDDYYTVMRARVSTNGGASFGSARKIVTLHGEGGAGLALGDGVLYLIYQPSGYTLKVKRSYDLGANWSPPTTITTASVPGEFSFTTEGSKAVLAYVHQDFDEDNWGAVRYVQTTNEGQNWSITRSLTSHKTVQGRYPRMLLHKGVLHAFYRRGPEVVYRRSTDGTSWTPYESVAEFALPGGIVIAGRVILTFETDGSAGFTTYMSRRLR